MYDRNFNFTIFGFFARANSLFKVCYFLFYYSQVTNMVKKWLGTFLALYGTILIKNLSKIVTNSCQIRWSNWAGIQINQTTESQHWRDSSNYNCIYGSDSYITLFLLHHRKACVREPEVLLLASSKSQKERCLEKSKEVEEREEGDVQQRSKFYRGPKEKKTLNFIYLLVYVETACIYN